MHAARISVLVLSYNFEQYLRECIESVLAQTLPPFEIVICDDQSADQSWSIISEYSSRHPGLIKSFRHQKNIGMVANLNFAASRAIGDAIAFLDGDDIWYPRKLELEAKALDEHPGARISFSRYRTVDAGRRPAEIFLPNELLFDRARNANEMFFESFMWNQALWGVMDRKVFEDLGGFDPDVRILVDWDLMIRAVALYRFAFSGEVLMDYRFHDRGVHNSPVEEVFKDALFVYRKNFPSDGGVRDEKNFVRTVVEGRLCSFITDLKQSCDKRLTLIHQLTGTADERLQRITELEFIAAERLALIESLSKTAEERLKVIQVLDAEVRRLSNEKT